VNGQSSATLKDWRNKVITNTIMIILLLAIGTFVGILGVFFFILFIGE
jgi:hypothetical protein